MNFDLNMTLNLKGQVFIFCLIFAIICYNFVINAWIVFRLGQNNTLRQDLLGDQAEFDHDNDLKMTLTINVKLLNLSERLPFSLIV